MSEKKNYKQHDGLLDQPLNWLTHIVLSKDDVDYQLGNLLADALKGVVWEDAGSAFIEGVAMHRAIDTFTDSHSLVSQSKGRLGEKGYLKGVVVDVLYDHFLSRKWDEFIAIPRPDFINTFHENAVVAVQVYPKQLKRFAEALVTSNRLSKYQSFEGFVSTLQKMDGRISQRIREKESAVDYVPAVQGAYDELEQDFLQFFPELISFFQEHNLGDRGDHILTKTSCGKGV